MCLQRFLHTLSIKISLHRSVSVSFRTIFRTVFRTVFDEISSISTKIERNS